MSRKEELKIIFEAILSLNEFLGDGEYVTYSYNEEDDAHAIVHNFHDRLFSDECFAFEISNLFFELTVQKGLDRIDFYSL